MTLTDAERELIERENRWRQERDEERATRGAARTKGLLAMIDIGFVIYARTGDDPDIRPQGGIVLGVFDWTYDDPETGERTTSRTFNVIDPATLAHHSIDEAAINPDAIELPDAHRSHRTISLLALKLTPKARRTLLEDEDQRLNIVADMHRLAASIRRPVAV